VLSHKKKHPLNWSGLTKKKHGKRCHEKGEKKKKETRCNGEPKPTGKCWGRKEVGGAKRERKKKKQKKGKRNSGFLGAVKLKR